MGESQSENRSLVAYILWTDAALIAEDARLREILPRALPSYGAAMGRTIAYEAHMHLDRIEHELRRRGYRWGIPFDGPNWTRWTK